MKNFKRLFVLVLALVMCLTAVSINAAADVDDVNNVPVNLTARFDDTGSLLIATVTTGERMGAIKATLKYAGNISLNAEKTAQFIEGGLAQDSYHHDADKKEIVFVVSTDNFVKDGSGSISTTDSGNTLWADFYFDVKSIGEVTFQLTDIKLASIDENENNKTISVADQTLNLSSDVLLSLGAQYREGITLPAALRFGSRINRVNENGKSWITIDGVKYNAVRCGFLYGSKAKLGGDTEKLRFSDFNTKNGAVTYDKTLMGHTLSNMVYILEDDYMVYTVALQIPPERADQEVCARPYTIYYSGEGGWKLIEGDILENTYNRVQGIDTLINDISKGYENQQ